MMKLVISFFLVLAVLEIAAKPYEGQDSNKNDNIAMERTDEYDNTNNKANALQASDDAGSGNAADDTTDDEDFEDSVNLVYCFKIKKGEILRSINPISIFDALESSVITEETIEEMRNKEYSESLFFAHSARDLSKAENRDDITNEADAPDAPDAPDDASDNTDDATDNTDDATDNTDDATDNTDDTTDTADEVTTTEATPTTTEASDDAEDFKDSVHLVYCFKIKKGTDMKHIV